MLYYIHACWLILSKFRHYQPQQVTIKLLYKWLLQFPAPQRRHVVDLFCRIIFLTQEEIKTMLVSGNESLIEKLAADGVGVDNIIYVQFDKAGSSSPVMLNMLRDAANLERRKANFVDGNNLKEIIDLTYRLGTGAIVYVDDFSGTGKQFVRSRRRVAQYVVGTFSEFFLAPCICEEAIDMIEAEGVQPVPGMVHKKDARPLHEETTYFRQDVKLELATICRSIHRKQGLGFYKLATMVVLYRNAPNTVPLIFRGSLGQKPYFGIFPRSDDLPF